jgi:hypothetical protein
MRHYKGAKVRDNTWATGNSLNRLQHFRPNQSTRRIPFGLASIQLFAGLRRASTLATTAAEKAYVDCIRWVIFTVNGSEAAFNSWNFGAARPAIEAFHRHVEPIRRRLLRKEQNAAHSPG